MPALVLFLAIVGVAILRSRNGALPLWPVSAGPRLVAREVSGVVVDEAPAGQTPRRFGALREGGRLHAGVDLPATSGSAIAAMDDGVVLGILPGYVGLDAIAVDHPNLGAVLVYAEFARDARTVPGLRVARGQILGRAAASAYGSMLHVEAWERGRAPKAFTAWLAIGPRPLGLVDPTTILLRAR